MKEKFVSIQSQLKQLCYLRRKKMEKNDVENEILAVVSAKLKTNLSCDEIKTLCEAISYIRPNDLLTQLLERNMFSGFGAALPEDKDKKN